MIMTRVTACWVVQPPTDGSFCPKASSRPIIPAKPLVSYQRYRQLPGWILPPLVKSRGALRNVPAEPLPAGHPDAYGLASVSGEDGIALPDWVRTSTDAVSKAFRLRRTGRQDLIDAVERGDMTLEAALEEAEAKEQPNQKGGGEV
jgi:hypothetical protein